MTDWSALVIFRDILITYYFGSPVIFYVSLVAFFLLALVIAGLDMRMALIFSLPLVGAFAVYGVFGAYTWIGNAFLLVIGILYAYILIELFT